MNYKHFTIEECCPLREYYVKGKSYQEIVRLFGRNVSSVSRELRRNCILFSGIYRDIIRIRRKRKATCETVTVTEECSGNKKYWNTQTKSCHKRGLPNRSQKHLAG